ncbi:GNAT family N-acetyltransferase [Salinivibrio sp. SS2]|uniref:GNAT family N-acetyltransferase n=1 Tax=Salinivibrio sp. SS2 TaxID=1892894 RepID=UPI00084C0EA1|nr:GNAT family N-acetyltransferase [Salinivibrio sp. DV]ODQ01385.1 GNAT family N-acetyltransferase [Salinivibrio sp. DV]
MSLIIRQYHADDIPAIRDIYAQPKAQAGTLQLPMPSLAMWEKRLNNVPDGVYPLVAELEGKVVGNLSFVIAANPRRRHVVDIGMGVHDAYQGRGIGSALMEKAIDLAENWLNVSRIELTVYTDNAAAIHLYQKFGFEIEGTAKQFAFRNGEFVDAHYMARTR